jgi:hypothetical protein
MLQSSKRDRWHANVTNDGNADLRDQANERERITTA